MPPGHEGETKALIKRMLRGDRGFGFETQHLRKDGSLLDVALALSPVRDAAGEITAISIIAHDISARVRAERELRESEEKFAAAFHASPDLMTITRLSDGRSSRSTRVSRGCWATSAPRPSARPPRSSRSGPTPRRAPPSSPAWRSLARPASLRPRCAARTARCSRASTPPGPSSSKARRASSRSSTTSRERKRAEEAAAQQRSAAADADRHAPRSGVAEGPRWGLPVLQPALRELLRRSGEGHHREDRLRLHGRRPGGLVPAT